MNTYITELTVPFTLKPRTTALIVVDMQNATGNRTLGLGKRLADQGRLNEASYRFDRIETLVVPNIQKLLKSFRKQQSPIFWITYGSEREDYSDFPKSFRPIVQATNNRVGNPEHDILAVFKPRAGEPVLNKVTAGTFASAGIDARLRAIGITDVVVVGISTNNCAGMTAMEASDRGYGSALVSDGTGTCSDEMQRSFEVMFSQRLWGRVLSTNEIIAELENPTT